MRTITSTRNTRLAAGSLFLILLGLGGCAGTPQPDPEPVTPPIQEKPKPTLPEKVSLVLPASAYSAQLREAERLLGQFRWMAASEVLDTIPAETSSVDDLVYLGYLQARIAYIRGEQQAALQQLAALDYPGVNPALNYRMLGFRRSIQNLAGDSLAAARLGQRLLQMAPKEEIPILKRDIWINLAQIDSPTLQSTLQQAQAPFLPPPQLDATEQANGNAPALAADETPPVAPLLPTPSIEEQQWQAWLELALLSRENLPQLQSQLPQWLQRNSGHPATRPLPGGLGFLLDSSLPPASVALLLPLSGNLAPAGRAVRDGYLASYYASRAAGTVNWEVLVLDVDRYNSTTSAYSDAISKGAKVVIGPLSKKAVSELANSPRPVPVLALNRADGLAATEQEETEEETGTIPPPTTEPGLATSAVSTTAVSTAAPHKPQDLAVATGTPIATATAPVYSSTLIQFSLAPEDEANSLAERAFGHGARSALVIRPAGDWGDKMTLALTERWTHLGGTIADRVSYNSREEYSASVKDALGIPASEQRARDIGDMLATSVEFSARRRQDVDTVFLLARNGAEARSLKPLLAFHYAGNLPIYATSSIYNGTPSPGDRDLDGINLVEMPWLLGVNPNLKAELAAGTDSYTRLNALGADAFLLQSRWRQLQAGSDTLLRGNTGLLSLDAKLQVQRELPLATFDEGAITPQ